MTRSKYNFQFMITNLYHIFFSKKCFSNRGDIIPETHLWSIVLYLDQYRKFSLMKLGIKTISVKYKSIT
ncbi:hypothetical protein D3C87_2114560 [compost metagenome]